MKKIIFVAVMALIVYGGISHQTVTQQPVLFTIAGFSEPTRRSVIEARSYEELRNFLIRSRAEDIAYPVLQLGIGKEINDEEYSYLIIPSLADLPTHSMRAPCSPATEPKEGCWFIYYTDEKKK